MSETTSRRNFMEIWSACKCVIPPLIREVKRDIYLIYQLGTFSVNGEWVCGGLFALVAKSGPTGAEHVARSQLDRYVLFLTQSVIIKCEIQCSYKRIITLLNNVYLTASYITYLYAHCDRACARTQLPIPHIQFRMIITAT